MTTPKPNLDSLFHSALEMESLEEREAFLTQVCGHDAVLRSEVERLLESHQKAGTFLEQPAPEYFGSRGDVAERDHELDDIDVTSHMLPKEPETEVTLRCDDPKAATASNQSPHEMEGELIAGKYCLVELIGEGGMGSVWRAKQSEPIKRFVAVKLIKAGMDSRQVLSRFNTERQALALMDHPNIAKVLDGGLHHERPYFVMELVKGLPITEYCDKCRLTPPSRLELFVSVCQAIQHAHQKGVIHRDIKPSNVLVALYDDRW